MTSGFNRIFLVCWFVVEMYLTWRLLFIYLRLLKTLSYLRLIEIMTTSKVVPQDENDNVIGIQSTSQSIS